MEQLDAADVRLVAGLLVGGFAVFFTGAVLWRLAYQRSLPESLAAIADSHVRWRWINCWMAAGVTVTLIGMAGLTYLFTKAGGQVYSVFGFTLFAIGALVWLPGVAWRLSVLDSAADEFVVTGEVDAGVEAWGRFFEYVHGFHMILAYLSWVALAASIFDTGILPHWVAWMGVVLGSTGAAGYVSLKGGPFAPPIQAHLYTLVLGVALLVKWT